MVPLFGHFVEGDVAGGGAGENVHRRAGDALLHLQPVAGGHLPVHLPGGDQGRNLNPVQAVQRIVGFVGVEMPQHPLFGGRMGMLQNEPPLKSLHILRPFVDEMGAGHPQQGRPYILGEVVLQHRRLVGFDHPNEPLIGAPPGAVQLQGGDFAGIVDGQLLGGGAPQRQPGNVRPFHPQMVQQGRRVVRQYPHGIGPGVGGLGGLAGPPGVVGDHLKLPPVGLHLPGPHAVVGGGAHNQQQRIPFPGRLVVNVDSGGQVGERHSCFLSAGGAGQFPGGWGSRDE